MQRTSSYLKGLAETRARAAGDVQRLEQLHAEITAQLEAARAEVTSCGLLIRKFDRQLDPTAHSAETGHPFHLKLDTQSTANWTVGAKRRMGWMMFTPGWVLPSISA